MTVRKVRIAACYAEGGARVSTEKIPSSVCDKCQVPMKRGLGAWNYGTAMHKVLCDY